MKRWIFLVLSLQGLACAVSQKHEGPLTAPPPQAALRPDVLWLRQGKVWVNEGFSASSVAVAAGKILAVGSDSEVEAALQRENLLPGRVIDLNGRYVLPGFIDAHQHILSGGRSLTELNLSSATTKEEILARIRDDAEKHPEKSWITGRGWNYGAFRPGMPTRQELDAVVPDRPVWLRSYDGHTGWANTQALKLAKVSASTPDGKDGKIDREKGSRQPSGIFREGAMDLIRRVVPPLSALEKKAAWTLAFQWAAQHGLTTLCEVGASAQDFSLLQEMEAEAQLPLRVVYGPGFDTVQDMKDFAAKLPAKDVRNSSTRHLLPGPFKGFMDGVIESNTAALLKPYADGSGKGSPPAYTLQEVEAHLRTADELNMDVAYHAVGDRAVRVVLDAVENVSKNSTRQDRRTRIEHIEVVSPDDLPRFAKLGVVASMMLVHAEPGDEPNGGVWATKVGAARLPHSFAFASLTKAGASMAYGSDWPVMTLNPLRGVAVAMTRQGPDGKPEEGFVPGQRLSLAQALDGYTQGSARALRLEAVTGKIQPGWAADLVVLEPSANVEAPLTLFETRVDFTLAFGKVVYERK